MFFRDLSRCTRDTSAHRLFTCFIGLGDTDYRNTLLCFLSTTGTHLSSVHCCFSASLWPPFGTRMSVGLSSLTSATRRRAGLGECGYRGSSIFLFKCESMVSMRAWLMCTIHFRAASRKCESERNHHCACGVLSCFQQFRFLGSACQLQRPSLLQYQWRKMTPDSRSHLFWARTGTCMVRFRLPQLVAFIFCFSQQGS